MCLPSLDRIIFKEDYHSTSILGDTIKWKVEGSFAKFAY